MSDGDTATRGSGGTAITNAAVLFRIVFFPETATGREGLASGGTPETAVL